MVKNQFTNTLPKKRKIAYKSLRYINTMKFLVVGLAL
jgi:hypothetical protein